MTSQEITALTALAAVIIGPLVTLYVAKRQIKANTISANRQEWINKLRNELAHLIKDIKIFAIAVNTKTVDNKVSFDKFDAFCVREETIKLMVNPNEANHKELLRLIKNGRINMLIALNEKDSKVKELDESAERIVTLSQQILKEEWERVKNGD